MREQVIFEVIFPEDKKMFVKEKMKVLCENIEQLCKNIKMPLNTDIGKNDKPLGFLVDTQFAEGSKELYLFPLPDNSIPYISQKRALKNWRIAGGGPYCSLVEGKNNQFRIFYKPCPPQEGKNYAQLKSKSKVISETFTIPAEKFYSLYYS